MVWEFVGAEFGVGAESRIQRSTQRGWLRHLVGHLVQLEIERQWRLVLGGVRGRIVRLCHERIGILGAVLMYCRRCRVG